MNNKVKGSRFNATSQYKQMAEEFHIFYQGTLAEIAKEIDLQYLQLNDLNYNKNDNSSSTVTKELLSIIPNGLSHIKKNKKKNILWNFYL